MRRVEILQCIGLGVVSRARRKWHFCDITKRVAEVRFVS